MYMIYMTMSSIDPPDHPQNIPTRYLEEGRAFGGAPPGAKGGNWGSLLISWGFHGNSCVILMGIP